MSTALQGTSILYTGVHPEGGEDIVSVTTKERSVPISETSRSSRKQRYLCVLPHFLGRLSPFPESQHFDFIRSEKRVFQGF